MATNVYEISLTNLGWIFIPVVCVIIVQYRWTTGIGASLHGLVRMLLQLVVIGYALNFIFSTNQAIIVMLILTFMLALAALIALRPLAKTSTALYFQALIAIVCSSLFTLIIVSQLVLTLPSWYEPRYIITLAGMIFANAMNAVSLAAERFFSDRAMGTSYCDSRSNALRASLIPITNSLFAVGLVSLPGMMTGQILSGTSPLIAARYQIMVMCMIFGSAGLASGIFLRLQKGNC